MIAHIEGIISSVGDRTITIDVGGVGYALYITPETQTSCTLGEKARLYTHLSVRQDTWELYGFQKQEERALFLLLLSVPSIGPKTALAIIGVAPVTSLSNAIASGDATLLTNVAGIGKKIAEKIMVELRDKLLGGGYTSTDGLQETQDILEALKQLGYSQNDAREAVKKIPNTVTETGARVKEALKILGNKH